MFNKEINNIKLSENLLYLKFGYYFNQYIDNINFKITKLKYLYFGVHFNKPIRDIFPDTLNYLYLNIEFDSQLYYPSNLKLLSIQYPLNNIIYNNKQRIKDLDTYELFTEFTNNNLLLNTRTNKIKLIHIYKNIKHISFKLQKIIFIYYNTNLFKLDNTTNYYTYNQKLNINEMTQIYFEIFSNNSDIIITNKYHCSVCKIKNNLNYKQIIKYRLNNNINYIKFLTIESIIVHAKKFIKKVPYNCFFINEYDT
jgi:hypothetical protein